MIVTSHEVTIEMPARLLDASVVTRCQPFKMPRPIACVCARSSLSRLDAETTRFREPRGPLVAPSLALGTPTAQGPRLSK